VADLPEPLERLVARLLRLPGIGRRGAQRIAFHLAGAPAADVRALAEAIAALPEVLSPCIVCGNIAGAELCPVCADPRRDRAVLCVVELAENLAAVERTAAFRGVYHVLGGAISPLRGVGPGDLAVDALLARLATGEIREVILATNPTVEGEATAHYLARLIVPSGVRVTRPATGLPVGGELDFIDQATLARALEARQGFD
jgi:recombination protein RecR